MLKCEKSPFLTPFPLADDDDKAEKKGNKENLDVLAKAVEECAAGVNEKSACAENGTADSQLLIQQVNERTTITHTSDHSEL